MLDSIVPEIKLAPPKFDGDLTPLLEQARKATELLKALSHESRLLILCLLSQGEKSVSELEAIMAIPQAAVSQQLARLRSDDLVQTRRDGRQIYYSIASVEASTLISTLYELYCKPIADDANGR